MDVNENQRLFNFILQLCDFKYKGGKINVSVIRSFLVPDLYRATERNGNRISADVTEDTIENDQNEACFSYFQKTWQVLLTF